MSTAVLEKRRRQVATVSNGKAAIDCAKPSLAGSVSQRACVFCGSRVVLYPIVDAVHLIHGPAGCASYTWDIRGTVSSGPELHRLSFTTDLREKDVIFGGAEKLERALRALIARYNPRAAFVYTTCIVGVIGDDVDSVCKKVGAEVGIPVIPVRSEGFRGTKKDGYAAACDALAQLIGTLEPSEPVPPYSINILGDFNLAGELWILEDYYRRMGVNIQARITGDGRVDDIRKAHRAKLNVVQCSGSMIHLAKHMKEKYGVPFKQVSYFGIEDMSAALYDVASFFNAPELHERAAELVRDEVSRLLPMIEFYRARLSGRKAVIYVGGAFKTISLIKVLRLIGIETVVCGSQTGRPEDYETMAGLCNPGTIIVDDSNPVELSTFARERGADLFIGGVKERPIAFKMGMAFCDHNHERKLPLAGYEGMKNFVEEVYGSVMTPVWQYARSRKAEVGGRKPEETVVAPSPRVERQAPGVENLRPPASDPRAPNPDAVTVNPCKVCAPLGACVAFRGVAGCIPLIHGSQGCATYIRRYTISHFREPMDIASSSISEDSTVFGGTRHFSTALDNIIRQYSPAAVGVCTSCLSETIGDDVSLFVREYEAAHKGRPMPALIRASTPSYKGTHTDGFHAAVRAMLSCTVKEKNTTVANRVSLLPGFVSPADLRYLKTIMADFGLDGILVPDYSETLDGPSWDEYHRLPKGGTPVERIAASADSAAVVQLGRVLRDGGGDWLEAAFGTPCRRLGLPIGLRESDALFGALAELSGRPVPREHALERGRLLDSFVDGHKYLFGKRAVVYGEEDFVVGIASFLNEIGINPVLKTLELIHAAYPDLIFCLSTNGLNLYDHIDRLAEVGVSHVTITINAVDPMIGAQIYAWVRHKKRVLRGLDAAKTLLDEQLRCIPKLKAAGMLVKINSILISGINEAHIPEVAKKVKELGADIMNVIPVLITEGTAFADRMPPSSSVTEKVRTQVAECITLMSHCRRCRADAVGLLGQDDPSLHAELGKVVGERTWIVPGKPYVAVATHERLLINGHLGDAKELHIFEKRSEGRFGCVGVRKMPEPGSGDNRWRAMAAVLRDCSAIMVADAGVRPEEVLAEEGILLVRASGLIDGCLNAIYTGSDLKKIEPARARQCGGGTTCGGNGMGCCA